MNTDKNSPFFLESNGIAKCLVTIGMTLGFAILVLGIRPGSAQLSPPLGQVAQKIWWSQHGGGFHRSTDPTRPAILLVHGLHSSSKAWTSPADDPGVGGYYYDHRHIPARIERTESYLGVGIYKEGKSERSAAPLNANNWFNYLVGLNYTVATWSQPGETFNDAYPSAVEAYNQFVNATQAMNPASPPPIALIGHSRGGLLIRKLLKEKVLRDGVGMGRVRWAITLHSPHQGTDLAKGPEKLFEEVGITCNILPDLPVQWTAPVRNMCKDSLDALTKRLAKPGSRELTPGGPVVGPLAQGESQVPGVTYHTFGGTIPTYIRYYLWYFTANSAVPQYKCEDNNPLKCKQYFKWEAVPREIPNLSPMYDTIRDFVPEITPGWGDGLVANARATLPFATHTKTNLNHAEVLWDRDLQNQVVRLLVLPRVRTPVPLRTTP